jgi:hypothetical protein
MPIWVVIVLTILASFEILVIGLGIVDEIADRKHRAILKKQRQSRSHPPEPGQETDNGKE